MYCPRCTFPIEPMVTQGVEIDHCGRCQGTFFDPGEAPRVFGDSVHFDTWRDLWVAYEAKPSLMLRCPKDGTRLLAYTVSLSEKAVVVDVCPHCYGMWLDCDEGRHLHALVEGALAAEQKAQLGYGAGGYLFQFFTQMPLEVWNPLRRRPHFVHGLLAMLAGCYALELLEKAPIKAYRSWMLVPVKLLDGQNTWTLLTHGFFHAGWLHLLGNLYFLWIFGDNVEDRLGKRDFAIVYVSALVAGGLAYAIANPSSRAPMLGASGAIAGLMGAYLVLFPRVQLWVMLLVARVRLRATWYIGLWVALQVVMQLLGVPGTAWMAHLGGFAAGGLTALLLRPRPTLERLQA